MKAKPLNKTKLAAFAKETSITDLQRVADSGKDAELVEVAIEEINRRKIESDFNKVKEAFDSDQMTADEFLQELIKYNSNRIKN